MNQVSLSGNNPNPVMSARPKASPANIIGLCGFALFALAEIVGFALYYYIMSAIESGEVSDRIEFFQFLFDLRILIADYAFPIAFLLIGCFFVMDMIKRKDVGKFIDIIGLIALVLLLVCNLRGILIDMEGKTEYEVEQIELINSYFWYTGFIILTLFFAGFWGNAKLRIPSLSVVTFTLAHWALFLLRTKYNTVINYKLGTCADILAICSMVWFMVQYMRIGGAEVNFSIKIKPESQVAARSVATALCLCLGVAYVFVPFMYGILGWYDSSVYELISMLHRMGGSSISNEVYIPILIFIPAILLYAAAIMDKGIVKPIIALFLTFVPFIMLLNENPRLSNWAALIVVLLVALIGLTITIVANSRKPNLSESETQTPAESE